MYHQYFSTKKTPQSQPIPGRKQDMVKARSGGYVFGAEDWKILNRFLILGITGNSYYASARELAIENFDAILGSVKRDGERVVARVVDVSVNGRAIKNDPALYVLAMCAGEGDAATRRYALDSSYRAAFYHGDVWLDR